MKVDSKFNLIEIRQAIEASWSEETAYHNVTKAGNPSFGQCLPTSFVIHHFFPEIQIVRGKVLNGNKTEEHYWNGIKVNDELYHIDLTWQQFPIGTKVLEFEIFDTSSLTENSSAFKRCQLLLRRVNQYLSKTSKP